MSTTYTRLKPLLFLFISFLSFTSNSKDQLPFEEYNVLFDTDKSRTTKGEYDRFKSFYASHLAFTEKIELIGHTDNRGSDEYNMKLSERRVEYVKRMLIQFGYDKAKISISYEGESKPLNKNANPNEMTRNRRVTVLWEYLEPEIQPVVEEIGDIRELYKLLEQEKQEFCINPYRDTILRLEQGTIITIPANAFRVFNDDCVTFRAKEVYKFSDMVMENLSTTSDGHLLETGGMVYTEAYDSNGKELQLNSGKKLTLMLPTDSPRDDMQLFYGNRDPHSQVMNWEGVGSGGGIPSFAADQCPNYTPDRMQYCYTYCPIFFCRIVTRAGRPFKGMFNKDARQENKAYRRCQRSIRRGGGLVSSTDRWMDGQIDCDSLYELYGAESWQELQDTLQKIQMAKTEDKLKNGEANANELTYYVAQVSRLGWMNCDAFSGIAESKKIDMTILGLQKSRESDCHLVFKDRRSMMKSDYNDSKFKFSRILPGLAVWILGLKYRGKQAFISLTSSKTSSEFDGSNSYRAVTIDELKSELRKLDM
jgi:hypothetical protein